MAEGVFEQIAVFELHEDRPGMPNTPGELREFPEEVACWQDWFIHRLIHILFKFLNQARLSEGLIFCKTGFFCSPKILRTKIFRGR